MPAQRQLPSFHLRGRQRGMVTLIVMLFLVATVVFVTTRMLDINNSNVIDSQAQVEGHAAFFLAESGIERARSSLATALTGTITNASCTGVTGTFSLAGGSVSYSAASTPPTCTSAPAGTPCTTCTITSVGAMGTSSRTVKLDMALATENGVVCNTAGGNNCTNSTASTNAANATWKLSLTNNSSNAAIALFNLAYPGQGNVNASCGTASNCQKQFELGSPSNGTNSVGIMGNSVAIAAGGSNPAIYQVFPSNKNSNIAEVGALFTGSSAPTLAGAPGAGGASYWDEDNTVGRSDDNGGSTNNGTATSTGTCSNTSSDDQSCTRWCRGGDTLVFSFAANVDSINDKLNSVTFNTGTGGQNIALTSLVKYPTALVAGAPTNVNAEIWYARNPDYLSPTASVSSGGTASASIGATFNSSVPVLPGSATLIASSISGQFTVGDTVTCVSSQNNCSANLRTGAATPVTITAIAGTGSTRTLTLSASVSSNSNSSRQLQAASTRMVVSSVTSGYISVGDRLTGTGVASGTVVSAIAGAGNVAGNYQVSPAQVKPGNSSVTAAGTTLHVSGGSTVPTAGTILKVSTGTGVFQAQTRVLASPAPTATQFSVDKLPSTTLSSATVCGGTCAFFSNASRTTFAINKTAGTNEWASGFTCLKGVDIEPQIVTQASSRPRRWTEPVN